LSDHVADLAAARDHLDLDRYCLLGFSRGASYALAFALRQPTGLAGLVVFDYPAQHRRLAPGWAADLLANDGVAAAGGIAPEVLFAIERESHDVSLWEELHRIACPTLIVRGARQSALLDDAGLQRYRQGIRQCRTLLLEESGHQVTDDDADIFVAALAEFLGELDHRPPGCPGPTPDA
jgi:pimeloyl-ACP methyl ester carboxylesterase